MSDGRTERRTTSGLSRARRPRQRRLSGSNDASNVAQIQRRWCHLLGMKMGADDVGYGGSSVTSLRSTTPGGESLPRRATCPRTPSVPETWPGTGAVAATLGPTIATGPVVSRRDRRGRWHHSGRRDILDRRVRSGEPSPVRDTRVISGWSWGRSRPYTSLQLAGLSGTRHDAAEKRRRSAASSGTPQPRTNCRTRSSRSSRARARSSASSSAAPSPAFASSSRSRLGGRPAAAQRRQQSRRIRTRVAAGRRSERGPRRGSRVACSVAQL
jgi:hypothetical protein